ncbi:hypothetical protein [Maridesulfovibrio salexigens]|uniref:Solute-binding protein family 3/N-terminal domain-containing protein n=1 Tax=Maridesulfovibrio salexigens (strain ATCC 14822 / DSM 2638 / NCIMB 8403 / VKM B-1763) TaxID=526222 RepID=C6BY80_MARSD|nr:hypothetical protein [Maridesulfovibrio salexigens]ACS80610.1 hypothetical protein Desal_2554 [Maridesulfovibrio salexigens DSM 2638]
MQKILIWLTLLFCAQPAFAQAPLQAVLLVDRPLPYETYIYRLLELALKNQQQAYKLEIEIIDATQPRRVKIVSSSPKNYVIALGNRNEHEKQLQPIYIPIQLGLGLGQRIMLTRSEVRDSLKGVKNLKDLSKFVFAQGLGWSDVKILQDAGLKVYTPADPASIPGMLMRKRVDLYPRGLFEIDLEYKRYVPDHPDLVIDDNIVLTYPLASFFYVREDNKLLHDAIKKGLEKAYYSGQLQDLIMTDPTFSKTLREIQLDKRVKIEVPVESLDVSEKALSALKKFTFVPGKKVGEKVK